MARPSPNRPVGFGGTLVAVSTLAAAGLVAPTTLHAWAPVGHRAVALVAANHLSPDARRQVAQLLGSETLADVAVWADEIRDARPETSRWHYVNINIAETTYKPAVHCKPAEAGDCILAAIERSRATLADRTQPGARRLEALKFLVHFVADLHQPLHCGDRFDRGGNDVEVQWFGEPTNLHALWDGGFTNRMGLAADQLARRLQQGLTPQQIASLQQGSVVEWALASHRLARDHAYAFHPSRNLGARYFSRHRGVVEAQILRGGLRLARLLNEAL